MRGIGLQKYGAPTSIFGYWAISIPLCYFLTFKLDMGMKGLWLGMPLGLM